MAKLTEKSMDEFKKELGGLLNSHCIENECDMPDFLLAEMIVNFIQGTGRSIKQNLDWHGCDSTCHPKCLTKNACVDFDAHGVAACVDCDERSV